MFNEARTREYQLLKKELKKFAKPPIRDKSEPGILRLKRRLQQIVEIDFFGSPMRARVEEAVQQLENDDGKEQAREGRKSPKDYVGRTWITRPHPGISRVSSACLIVRYIDPHAKFAFDRDPRHHPDAIPFDMFNAGRFGHVGNDCTFETLPKGFRFKDSRLSIVHQPVNEPDL